MMSSLGAERLASSGSPLPTLSCQSDGGCGRRRRAWPATKDGRRRGRGRVRVSRFGVVGGVGLQGRALVVCRHHAERVRKQRFRHFDEAELSGSPTRPDDRGGLLHRRAPLRFELRRASSTIPPTSPTRASAGSERQGGPPRRPVRRRRFRDLQRSGAWMSALRDQQNHGDVWLDRGDVMNLPRRRSRRRPALLLRRVRPLPRIPATPSSWSWLDEGCRRSSGANVASATSSSCRRSSTMSIGRSSRKCCCSSLSTRRHPAGRCRSPPRGSSRRAASMRSATVEDTSSALVPRPRHRSPQTRLTATSTRLLLEEGSSRRSDARRNGATAPRLPAHIFAGDRPRCRPAPAFPSAKSSTLTPSPPSR